MIGIKDSLELNATLHGKNDRLADRIIGSTKRKRKDDWRAVSVSQQPNPLRRYTRSTFNGLLASMGQPPTNSQPRTAA
jgi:hypothetical protein